RLKLAFHNPLNVVPALLYTMVCDAVLGDVVGADFLGPVCGAYLRLSLSRVFCRFFLLLELFEFGYEDTHGFFSVLELAALSRGADVDSGRLMDDAYGSFYFVYVLPPGSSGTGGFYLKICRLDFYRSLFSDR